MMSFLKGWFGEKITGLSLWSSLDKSEYQRFSGLIIPSRNGTTQLDHVIISKYGIFIIETKNKKGWIYGSENQAKWTQIIYGSRYQFQNPLRQTFRQKKLFSEFFSVNEAFVNVLVYFVGNCEFQTPMPQNVISSGLSTYIKSFKNIILSDNEIFRISSLIENHVSRSGLKSKDHLRSLSERHNSNEFCPKCGSKLVTRTAKNGFKAGDQFLGCEKFPKCRFSKNKPKEPSSWSGILEYFKDHF